MNPFLLHRLARTTARLVSLVGVLVLVACGGGETAGSLPPATAAATASVAATPAVAPTGLTDRLIVHPAGDALQRAYETRAAQFAADLSSTAGITLRPLRQTHAGSHVLVLPDARPAAEVAQLAAKLAARSDVAFAEPDQILHASLLPNDTQFARQWPLREPTAVQGGVNAVDAWDLSTGDPNLVVAVVDTGILRHAEFNGRVLPGYDFVSNATVANDGDGRDADASDPGDWVTASEAAQLGLSSARASSWHGTHVAGTIAATGNNGTGVAGINWKSKILPVRALGKGGGYMSDIADAIAWASGGTVTGAPQNTTPARVINLSLGATGACTQTMQTAINTATARNAVVVIAAGNENTAVTSSQPANCSGVISVGAVGANGQRASYSNYGSTLTISAPGGDPQSDSGVLSLGDSGQQAPLNDNSLLSAYGTSMAAPHVSGVVSLILSVNPSLTPADVKSILQSTARAFPTGTGRDCNATLCGAGIVNAGSAVRAAANVQTGIASAVPQSGVWWNPAESGRGYVIEIRDGTLSFGVYLYDAAGQPTWFSTGGAMQSASSFSGTLYSYAGGQTLTGAYKAPTGQTAVGQIAIQFTSPGTAVLTWPGGTTVPLERFRFSSQAGPPTGTVLPEPGVWWNPQESGRGFAIEVQNGALVMSAFMFDDAGNPTWYIAGGAMSDATTFTGPLQVSGGGQTMTGPYRAPTVTNPNAGTITLKFTDTANATLTLPGGRQIPLTKFRAGTSSTGVTMPTNQVLTSRLVGIWSVTYRIISTFTDSFTFNEVRESTVTPGEYIVWGYNQSDNLAIGGWDPDMQRYSILAVGSTFDDFYVFDLTTPSRMQGCYYLVFLNPTRLSNCYTMVGTKLADLAPADVPLFTAPQADAGVRARQLALEDAQASAGSAAPQMADRAQVLALQPQVDAMRRAAERRRASLGR